MTDFDPFAAECQHLALRQPLLPIATMAASALLLRVEADIAIVKLQLDTSLVQRDSRQLKDPHFRLNLGELSVGQRFKHPDYFQGLSHCIQVTRVGKPGKAFDFTFCCFTRFGQRGDQQALQPRQFTFACRHCKFLPKINKGSGIPGFLIEEYTDDIPHQR